MGLPGAEAMKRARLIDDIVKRITLLSSIVRCKSKNNLHSDNVVAENVYRDIYNIIEKSSYKNLNQEENNFPGGDLIDEKQKKLIQVTSDLSFKKIKETVRKLDIERFEGFSLEIIIMGERRSKYKGDCLPTSYIVFDYSTNIVDNPAFVNRIKNLTFDQIESIQKILEKEIPYPKPRNLNATHLGCFIEVLSQSGHIEPGKVMCKKSFEIEKKIQYNELRNKTLFIRDRSLYSKKLERVYQEYDMLTKNKSMYVIDAISRIYLTAPDTLSGEGLFSYILQKVKDKIIDAANALGVYEDELDFYVDIIVVDTFVRCKIFSPPDV